jgi:predicted MFS family arabinose efflux permease
VSLAATLSRIGLGVAADRGGGDPLRPVAAMLAVSSVAYLLLAVREPGVVAGAALAAGALGWAWPGGLTLAVIQRTPEAPAWAVGVMMSGLFAGAVAGPLLVGLLAEHDAFTAAWLLCGALALGAAALIELIRRRSGVGVPLRSGV